MPIPGDLLNGALASIAFIGCGNNRYADYLRVPLSSVDHSTAELGRIAGEMALELAAKPDQPPRSVLLEPKLVVRQSSSTAATHETAL